MRTGQTDTTWSRTMSKSKSRRSANVSTPSLAKLLSPSKTILVRQPVSPTISWLSDEVAQEAQYVRANFDNRRYDPRIYRPPGATQRFAARLTTARVPTQTIGNFRHRVRFARPDLVAVCLRRKVRKEVLHALHRTGRGRGKAPRRRNLYSNIKC